MKDDIKLTELIKSIYKEEIPDTGHVGEEFTEVPDNIQYMYHATDMVDAAKIVKSGAIMTGDNIYQNSKETPWWRDKSWPKPHYGKYVYAASQEVTKIHYGSATPEVTFVIDRHKLQIPMYMSNMEEGVIYIYGNVPMEAIVEIRLNSKDFDDSSKIKPFAKAIKKLVPNVNVVIK